MKTRVELKFLISIDDYVHLKRQVASVMEKDAFMTRDEGYLLSTLYFDDLYDSAVYDKADGIEFHRKYRIRTYENGHMALEFKTKNATLTTKESLTLDDTLANALSTMDDQIIKAYADKDLVRRLLIRMKSDHLKPRLVIDYLREAYIFHKDDVRVTFDKDIYVYNCYNKHKRLKVLEPRTMIMEVKYNTYLPDTIRKIVLTRKYQAIPYSKYLMGWLKLADWGVLR